MKALIIGASGQVGQALIKVMEARGWSWEGCYCQHPIPGQSLFRLDLADLDGVRQAVLSRVPAAVFLPCGWTSVDGCEEDPERARLINALASEAAAKAAARIGAALVYYSSEYVFGEQGGPYDEWQAPDPLGAYARSKLEGEERVCAACPQALVLRTTVVYGPEPQEKNFVYQLLAHLRADREMSVPMDQLSSPTYNLDLARASIELVERGRQGIWNAAGPEVMSRYECARLAAQVFELDQGWIKPVRTAELRQKARRPLGAGLMIGKLIAELGWSPRGPAEGLESMRAALHADG